jgi:niacin transporter
MKTNVKKMIITALLIAFSIVIPVMFGPFLRVYIPPFSATLASHVPLFIAMFLGPFEASVVGLGSALGFLFAFPDPIIAMRASTHIVVGLIGGKLVQKNMKYATVMAITGPIHGILEALVVYALTKNVYAAFIVTGIGTILHHVADSVITAPLIATLKTILKIDLRKIGEKSKNLVA